MPTSEVARVERQWAPPPWGVNGWTLAAAQLTAAGIVFPTVSAAFLWPMWTEYDGFLTIVGMTIVPLVVSIVSGVAAVIVGLPIRLIPVVRRWWFSHGGLTLAVAGSGLTGIFIGAAAVHAAMDAGTSDRYGWLMLAIGWAVFCIGTVHAVWPRRWSGDAASRRVVTPLAATTPDGLSPAAAPAPPARMPHRR